MMTLVIAWIAQRQVVGIDPDNHPPGHTLRTDCKQCVNAVNASLKPTALQRVYDQVV